MILVGWGQNFNFLVYCLVHRNSTGLCYRLSVVLLGFPGISFCHATYEPRREKTGLRGFRLGPTQTGLYSLRKELEA